MSVYRRYKKRTAKQAYQDFLKTEFWKELSRQKKESVGNRCETCGVKHRIQAHHIRYPHDWYETKMEDLEVLCRGCHRAEHGMETDCGWRLHTEIEDCLNFEEWLSRKMDELHHATQWMNRWEKKHLRRGLELFGDDPATMCMARNLLKFYAAVFNAPKL